MKPVYLVILVIAALFGVGAFTYFLYSAVESRRPAPPDAATAYFLKADTAEARCRVFEAECAFREAFIVDHLASSDASRRALVKARDDLYRAHVRLIEAQQGEADVPPAQ